MKLRVPVLWIVLVLTGCATDAVQTATPADPYPPDACRIADADVAVLELAPTPASAPDDPAAFARSLPIDRSLTRAARWQHQAQGWSSLTLILQSAGARSLSLHLSDLKLPPRTQIWFCSPDGRLRHGPYREAAGGELWTPIVPGERALLQIWTPTAAHRQLTGRLADAQGGYR